MTTTSPRYKSGDVREDGFIFRSYRHGKPIFYSKAAHHRDKLYTAFSNARRRAEEKDVPFDIDIDYIESIFPEDWICPVLGIPLVWGGERSNSPSLDRIIPEKGYVRGNLIWVSDRANMIKSNSTLSELKMVAEFYSHIQPYTKG